MIQREILTKILYYFIYRNGVLVKEVDLNKSYEDYKELWTRDFIVDKKSNIYILSGENIYKFSPTSETKESIRSEIIVYPNPCKGNLLNFRYNLKQDSRIRIDIYNIAGELIDSLMDTGFAGIKKTEWKIMNVASGTYIYKIEIISNETNKKENAFGKIVIIKWNYRYKFNKDRRSNRWKITKQYHF